MSRKRLKNYCCDKQALCVRLKIFLWRSLCDASRCAKFDTENPESKYTHNTERLHVIYNVVKLSVKECFGVFILVSLSVILILLRCLGLKNGFYLIL